MKSKETFHPRGALLPMLLAFAIGGAQAMKQGDLEIKASLDKAAYSAYEDVILKVEFRNHGNKPVDVPNLKQGAATYVLKDLGSGKSRTAENFPVRTPGTPNLPPAPFPLPAGRNLDIDLEPARLLGTIPKGRHSLQIKFELNPGTFTSDPLPFEMADAKIANAIAAPSVQGDAEYLRLAWRDEGGRDPRILFRTINIGPGAREEAFETVSFGKADGTSIPMPSSSPDGTVPSTAWLAWMSQAQLILASAYGRTTAEYASPAPEGTSDSRVAGLAYFPKHGDEAHERLAGLVCARSARGIGLHGFESAAKEPKPQWVAVHHAAGRLLDARLVPLSQAKRLILILRSDAGKVFLETLSWPEGKGFGAPTALATVPAPETRSDIAPVFDAVAVNGSAAWTLASAAKDGKHFDLAAGTVDADGHAHPRETRSAAASFAVRQSNPQVTLRLSPAGNPWILQRDPQGGWAQGGDLAQPRGIALPAGADFVCLYFRNGGHPKVSYYAPGTGFTTTAVVPDSGADNSRDDLR